MLTQDTFNLAGLTTHTRPMLGQWTDTNDCECTSIYTEITGSWLLLGIVYKIGSHCIRCHPAKTIHASCGCDLCIFE
jgi:hypothetical protein